MSDNGLELKLHPVVENEYIGTVEIDPVSVPDNTQNVQFVIILDKSGSMRDDARRVSNEIIPLFLYKLGYSPSDDVTLILFDSECQMHTLAIENVRSLPVSAYGGTEMAPAVYNCQRLFELSDESKPVRLLTISDGQVQDQVETEIAASRFVEFLKTKNFSINSQAVRLFTSTNQPDTTALCSLLQLNNMTTSQLVDISADEENELIAERIKKLFETDNLSKAQSFDTSNIFYRHPWDSTPSNKMTLLPGDNVFWVKGDDEEIANVKIGEQPVTTSMQPQVTLSKFQSLVDDKMDYIVDHMKVLKVVGTAKAEQKINSMQTYFENKEDNLMTAGDSASLKKISNRLSRIADDKNVAFLDAEQRAAYLRGNSNQRAELMRGNSNQGSSEQRAPFSRGNSTQGAADKKKQEDASDATSNKDLDIKMHPIDDQEFIGTVKIDPDSVQEKTQNVQFIIIFDKSGSMADAARRVSNEVIPSFLTKLGYKRTDVVYFIMFESRTQMEKVTVERLKSLPVRAAGGTIMAPAIYTAKKLFETLDDSKPVRLLTISDGQVQDQVETERAASNLIEYLKTKNFTINSQAVRLFTSNNQPDTTALCSLLQLNNVTTSQPADISADEDNKVIAEKIKKLFENDNLSKAQSFKTKGNFYKNPWDATPSDKMTFVPGDNVFWVKGDEDELKNMKVGVNAANASVQPQVTLSSFQSLMEVKMDYIVDHMKILKVVGTEEATETISTMLEYFVEKEETLFSKSSTSEKKCTKKISTLLTRIAEDDNVALLNADQRADYLRGADYTKKERKDSRVTQQKVAEKKVVKEEPKRAGFVYNEKEVIMYLIRQNYMMTSMIAGLSARKDCKCSCKCKNNNQ